LSHSKKLVLEKKDLGLSCFKITRNLVVGREFCTLLSEVELFSTCLSDLISETLKTLGVSDVPKEFVEVSGDDVGLGLLGGFPLSSQFLKSNFVIIGFSRFGSKL